MVDNVSPEVRSQIMAQVKSKGMKPEMRVRRLIHRLGYRYRLHRADLPGNPDLVFAPRQKIIFVHGCFWHRHKDCKRVRIPATNRDYWLAKLKRNQVRDSQNIALLEEAGWSVFIVWECQLQDISALTERLVTFLGQAQPLNTYLAGISRPDSTTAWSQIRSETGVHRPN